MALNSSKLMSLPSSQCRSDSFPMYMGGELATMCDRCNSPRVPGSAIIRVPTRIPATERVHHFPVQWSEGVVCGWERGIGGSGCARSVGSTEPAPFSVLSLRQFPPSATSDHRIARWKLTAASCSPGIVCHIHGEVRGREARDLQGLSDRWTASSGLCGGQIPRRKARSQQQQARSLHSPYAIPRSPTLLTDDNPGVKWRSRIAVARLL